MATVSSETLHASCVAIDGQAVLIEGSSGSGKSDLALRLIDRGARLVSDDYTRLVRNGAGLMAQPPDTIAGKIEVRGLGIVEMDHLDQAPVRLIVMLSDDPDRMPQEPSVRKIAGVTIPEAVLPALEPSSPIKIELALKRAIG